MLDVTTTITINGMDGDRFLSSLARYTAPLPRALRWLAASDFRSIEVGKADADLVARFVDDLLAAGWIAVEAPPLLYSPQVGDAVTVQHDVLAEVARDAPGRPPMWCLVPAGVSGKLLGWREGHAAGDGSRAVIDVFGVEPRVIVFVGASHITRMPRDSVAPVVARRTSDRRRCQHRR